MQTAPFRYLVRLFWSILQSPHKMQNKQFQLLLWILLWRWEECETWFVFSTKECVVGKPPIKLASNYTFKDVIRPPCSFVTQRYHTVTKEGTQGKRRFTHTHTHKQPPPTHRHTHADLTCMNNNSGKLYVVATCWLNSETKS